MFIAVPKNGLVVFCGTIITEEGKEKLVNMDFEAYRPINRSLYHCDNRFHTEVSHCIITMVHFLNAEYISQYTFRTR